MITKPLRIFVSVALASSNKTNMPKRPNSLATAVETSSSTKELTLYKKSYKGGGIKDPHYKIFQDVLRIIGSAGTCKKVLYPGCHRHLTPILFFPNVLFVDYDKKVASLYHPDDKAVENYIETNKLYEEDTQYEFLCADVDNNSFVKFMKKKRDDDGNKYDLLISLSAGLLTEPCTKYMATGSYLLVNDSHSDARMVFTTLKDQWQLVAYWDDNCDKFITEPNNLDRCFQVVVNSKTKPPPTTLITADQARESVNVGTVRKRSFKLLLEPMFFLFKKL